MLVHKLKLFREIKFYSLCWKHNSVSCQRNEHGWSLHIQFFEFGNSNTRETISDSSVEEPFFLHWSELGCTSISEDNAWLGPVVTLIILPLFTEWKLAGFFPLGGEIDDRSKECLWFIYKACTQNLVSLNAAETNNRHFSYSEFPSLSL